MAIIAAGLVLAACGKKNEKLASDAKQTVSADNALHATLPGTMSEGIKQNFASNEVEDCDKKSGTIAKTIINALEAKAAALDKYEKENGPKSTEVTAGSASFLRFERAAAQSGWKETQLSWTQAKTQFDKVKDTEASADWIELRNQAKTLVVDDRRRLVLGHNMGLGKDHEELLAKASKSAQDCGLDPNCRYPGFETSVAEFVNGNARYSKILKGIDESRTHNGARGFLQILIKRLEFDKARTYEFIKNASIYREGGELTVPFDAGTLPDELKGLLEAGWKNGTLTAKAFFAKPKPEFFKIELGAGPGVTFVDTEKKLVKLVQGIDVRRLAHEFGHVLGFRDRRYDVWNPKTCAYTVQVREDDIMSAPETGSVLEGDFETLDKKYTKGAGTVLPTAR